MSDQKTTIAKSSLQRREYLSLTTTLLLRMMFSTVNSFLLNVPKTTENISQTFVWHRTKVARNLRFPVEILRKNSTSGSLKIKTQTPRLSLTTFRLTDISFHSTCKIMASHQRTLPVVQNSFPRCSRDEH